jgi:molybdenum cofactor sulfurtransferase
MEKYMADMMSNLYGNPHSASTSSQLSTTRIENTRLSVLKFFKADPEHFDVVFVANATAGVKLVMDAFRSQPKGFAYGYHQDSHTSLVGVRETATSSRCLDDKSVERWLVGAEDLVTKSPGSDVRLFTFPAQSNLDGRRLPQSWLERVRKLAHEPESTTYTLLDASALVSTSQLDLSDSSKAADFTVLSFYKVFGFPDLGALIVRKDAGAILQQRKYFGGGTVDVVVCLKEQWHAPKGQSLHETLEDGTLPFHNIIALDTAIDVHRSLYGSMDRIASHTAYLARKLFEGLKTLKHANDEPVCVMYSQGYDAEKCSQAQGPTIAFNVKNSFGAWVTNIEFERLASIRNFHIRTGGLCNPGGVASALELQPWEMRRNFSAGLRCGGETDIYAGKITGAIRVSLGAISTVGDVDAFLSFMDEFFVDKNVAPNCHETQTSTAGSDSLYVESLTVYPIKSCGGFTIPAATSWEVRPEGLAWDREWCLVHQGTGQALSQKRYPKMALIQPRIDLEEGLLRIKYRGSLTADQVREINIPLSSDPLYYKNLNNIHSLASRVCGDAIIARTYSSPEVNKFFSDILDVPCSLARFPAGGSGPSSRHAKAHMQQHQRAKAQKMNRKPVPGSFPGPPTPPDSDGEIQKRPILLSNESPILAINRSSINRLNKEIEKSGGKPASASVFRANIVLASSASEDRQQPYDEDHWESLQIGSERFQMLGSCRRCHMICVDQDTTEKNEEPFVTLAKTRRFESKVFFGSHMSHVPSSLPYKEHQFPVIKVGDKVSVG